MSHEQDLARLKELVARYAAYSDTADPMNAQMVAAKAVYDTFPNRIKLLTEEVDETLAEIGRVAAKYIKQVREKRGV